MLTRSQAYRRIGESIEEALAAGKPDSISSSRAFFICISAYRLKRAGLISREVNAAICEDMDRLNGGVCLMFDDHTFWSSRALLCYFMALVAEEEEVECE